MRNYFIGLTCVINVVTIFSVIAQLSIESGTLAMNIAEPIKDGFDHVEIDYIRSMFAGGKIDVKNKNENLISSPYFRHPRRREIGVAEGGSLDMVCQLQDGSHWSRCEWKHGIRSLSITRSNTEEPRFVKIFGHTMDLIIIQK